MNRAGTRFEYATYLSGNGWDYPGAIAADGSGSAFVTGSTTSTDFPVTPGAFMTTPSSQTGVGVPFLTRLSADGSSLVYSTFTATGPQSSLDVAIDPAGNAAVYQMPDRGVVVMRFNSEGTRATFARTLPTMFPFQRAWRAIAMDAGGNTYVAEPVGTGNYPVKSSLAVCGTFHLTVYAPDGELPQATYLAGTHSRQTVAGAIALGPNSTGYLLTAADPAYLATRSIGTTAGPLLLTRLTPKTMVNAMKLACVANAASYTSGPVAAGEIVSLFGDGIGPAHGLQSEGPLTKFPASLGGVRVTFDGNPAPLLYVEESQINAIAPWSLVSGRTTEICATYNKVTMNCLRLDVRQVAPGVFMADGRYAAALNEDGTINSAGNPARARSIVTIFATGLGPVHPPPEDGAIVEKPVPVNLLPVGGIYSYGSAIASGYASVEASYAGPAPYLVAGVSQINLPAISNSMYLSVGQDFFAASAWSQPFMIHLAREALP